MAASTGAGLNRPAGPRLRVAVVGAGVVGLCTALALQRRGHEVLVLEAAPRLGAGASGANGAQLSWSYVSPLAGPGVWRQLPGLLAGRHAALRLVPRLQPAWWTWLMRFAFACRAAPARAAREALLTLSLESQAAFEAWRSRSGPARLGYRQAGKLVLAADAASWAGAAATRDWLASRGVPQQLLSWPECRALEPALAEQANPPPGASLATQDAVVDTELLVQALASELQAGGGQLRLGSPVLHLQRQQGRVCAACTPQGREVADAWVLCAGTGAPALAQRLGVALPIQPLKGYSLTVAGLPGERLPRHSITDLRRRVVLARLDDRLRVAGFVEVGARGEGIPLDRQAALMRHAQALLGPFPAQLDIRPWAGERPATPGGVPLVGPTSVPGLWLNTGHGALGLTLAFGSAESLADSITPRSP